MTKHAEIVGWGKCLPSKVVTNDDLAQIVDTNDEWIVRHTGIRERRVVQEGETTVSMAVEAAQQALRVAELDPADLDLIIVSTYSPDYHLPGAAPMVQAQLGASRAAAFDLRAGCPGFLYGLSIGSQFINSGVYQRVLVIGAEIVSHFVNWKDRRTCVLFGDGAGAAVLQATDHATGILSFAMGTRGEDYDAMIFRGAGCVHPIGPQPLDEGLRYLEMDGRRILNFAVRKVGPAVREQLRVNGLSRSDIALVVPQQSNLRFIEWIADKLGFPRDKVFVNVDRYANTSSASVAIALCEAFEEGRIREGDNVVLLSFGSGLNWAATLLRYGTAEQPPALVLNLPKTRWIALKHVRERVGALAETASAGVTALLNVALLPFLSLGKKK